MSRLDSTSSSRSAFTLIELLVVLGLMLALAVIAVAFVPRMAERQATWRAADRLQGWLVLARQWAKKDQVPTGIRLEPGQNLPTRASPNPTWTTDLLYIQQPADFFAQPGMPADAVAIRPVWVTTTTTTNDTVVLQRLPAILRPPALPAGNPPPVGLPIPGEFSGGNGGYFMTYMGNPYFIPNQLSLWPVQPQTYYQNVSGVPVPQAQAGDYIELDGGGLVHQIKSVTSYAYPATMTDPAGPDPLPGSSSLLEVNALILTSGLAQAKASPGTKNYRIIRGPRIVAGEQTLQLTQDVAIDMSLSRLPAGYTPGTPLDILFGPTGSVVGSGATVDKIILFVRDVTKPGYQGDLTLLTINCRTGWIGAQVPDLTTSTQGQSNLASTTSPVTLSVPNASLFQPFSYIFLDFGGLNPETQLVTSVNTSNNTITLQQVTYAHTAPFTIIVNPFAFALAPQTSGL